jgi:hypothetical protein
VNPSCWRVVTEQQKALAKQLARGRIFATGKAFTPFARADRINDSLDAFELLRGRNASPGQVEAQGCFLARAQTTAHAA